MSAIKDYLQSLKGEDLAFHLKAKVGDRSGTSSNSTIAEEREASGISESAIPETKILAAVDQKSTNGTARGKVVAVDTRGQPVQVMAVVAPIQVAAPIQIETKPVVLPDKKLELLSNHKEIPGDSEGIPRVVQQVPKSVVTISADGTTGKGFVFDQDGRIVTSCKLVHSVSRVKVTIHTGDVFLGKIVGLDSDLDLAIIQIPTKTLHHLPIAATGVELGADIFILNSASPTGGFTRAMINAVRLIEGTVLIQFDQPIPSSDCGSPLVTEQGTAIGIVSEKLRQDIDNTGFGVRLEELDRLSAD